MRIRPITFADVLKHARRLERTYYDPRTGLRWDLKRKPSNEDRVAISEAIQNDADIYTVLSDRNLISRKEILKPCE